MSTGINDYVPYIILGVYLAFAVVVIALGRLIIRGDLYRRLAEKRGKKYPPSRIIEDLQPVRDTLIEFIEASPPSSELLRRLAKANGPVRVPRLLASVAANEKSWTALFLIAAAGLVSFGRSGVFLTTLGGEIMERMSAPANEPGHRSPNLNHPEAVTQQGTLLSSERKNESDDGSSRSLGSWDSNKQPTQFTVPSAPAPDTRSNSRKESPPILGTTDYCELRAAIVVAEKLVLHPGKTQVLQDKLSQAHIFPSREVPADVITMERGAELLDLETAERLRLTPVFPVEADLEQERVSVFHPVGAGILGRRVGDRIDWTVPYGVRQLEIKAVTPKAKAAATKAA